MAGTGVGKFSSTAGSNTSNLTVNFAENMAPSNVNNAARELMGHIRDMYEQLGDGYFEFGDGDGEYTVARSDADTITITSSADISSVYFAGRKIRITDGGANVVEGTIASSSHTSTTQTVNLTGISLASGTPTKVELGVDTAAFGGRIILDDDGDTYIEAPTDDTIDIYVAGAKDFVITANKFEVQGSSVIDMNGQELVLDADGDTSIHASTDDQIDISIAGADDFTFTANTFSALSGSTIAAHAITNTTLTASGIIKTDDTTNATTTTDGSIQTDGGLSVALDAVIGDDLIMLSDSAKISFGADKEVELFHVPDEGLTIRHTATGDSKPAHLNLQSMEGTIAADEIIAKINFTAAGEDSGTDAIAVAGEIKVVAESDFTASNNASLMSFALGDSASATTLVPQMTLANGLVSLVAKATSTSDVTQSGIHFHDASTSAGQLMAISYTPSATANRARAALGFMSQAPGGSAGFGADLVFMTRSAADGSTLGTGDEAFRINMDHLISTNESAADVSSGGICLNQLAEDGKILSFKSSDVAHGMTDVAETDTYGVFQKLSSDGGMHIKALHDSGDQAIRMEAMAVTENSTKSTTGNSPFQMRSAKKNSAGLQAFGSNANLFHVSNNGATKFIVDAEGELHSDGGAQSAYDTYEDAHLVRAYDLSHGNGVINSQFDKFISYNHEALAEAKLVGRDEDGTPNNFVNVTGMQRLHNGAIWQQYEKTERLANAMYELAKAAVGEEKANKILEQNQIKLLN